MRPSTERALLGIVVAISLVMFGLQAFVVRPRLWPAGAGIALSGDTVMGLLAAPQPVAVIRPPNLSTVVGAPVAVLRVWPGGPAERGGSKPGDVFDTMPADAAGALRVWRDHHRTPWGEPPVVESVNGAPIVNLEHQTIWSTPDAPWAPWLRQHLGPLAQMAAFIIGAAVL